MRCARVMQHPTKVDGIIGQPGRPASWQGAEQQAD